MAKNRKKSSHQAVQELVTVAFAEDMEQAQDYRQLLRENDIPAVIKKTTRTPDAQGFAVMVPEDYLDEAHVIIESQNAYRDFCEYAFDDDDVFCDEDFQEDEF